MTAQVTTTRNCHASEKVYQCDTVPKSTESRWRRCAIPSAQPSSDTHVSGPARQTKQASCSGVTFSGKEERFVDGVSKVLLQFPFSGVLQLRPLDRRTTGPVLQPGLT